MSSYIPSSEMRRLLGLILRFQENLPTRIVIFNEDGQRREQTLYYRMRKLDNGIIQLHGFAINPQGGTAIELVSPEYAFYTGDFWLGAPKDVYKDYAPGNGKNQKLTWAAAYEQEATHPSFQINADYPVVTLTWSIAFLESLVQPENAGVVDDTQGGRHISASGKPATTGLITPAALGNAKGTTALVDELATDSGGAGKRGSV